MTTQPLVERVDPAILDCPVEHPVAIPALIRAAKDLPGLIVVGLVFALAVFS